MKPLTNDNVYVFCQGKKRGFWRKYKGQSLKIGRIFRYGWNTYGRGYTYDTIAKHNSVNLTCNKS